MDAEISVFELNSPYRLLAKIFTPAEADLAADLLPGLEPPAQMAARLGRDAQAVNALPFLLAVFGMVGIYFFAAKMMKRWFFKKYWK